jgi:o-succinylbenzoate---CoA ligase
MRYPFTTIWINGRFVQLTEIVQGEVIPKTEFENHTFSFIREWLSGVESFSIQTSGSTGSPKNISITRQQMIASATSTAHALDLKQYYNALVCIDTKYIGGKMMLVRCFVSGMRILALDPCAIPLIKIPIDHCVNFAAFVPYQVQSMLGSKHPHLMDNPDVVIVGGAPLDQEHIDLLQHLVCRYYLTYGMTETISHVALRRLNGDNASDFFEALPGITLEKDERGCLVIGASYLAGPVKTNDIADIKDNGRSFRWLGRWDNVINTGGVKVIPEKIEESLRFFFREAGITNRFFIQGMDDKKLGQKVVLVMEASGHTEVLQKKLSKIFDNLAPFEKPRAVLVSPLFHTTESGKINRMRTAETANGSLAVS